MVSPEGLHKASGTTRNKNAFRDKQILAPIIRLIEYELDVYESMSVFCWANLIFEFAKRDPVSRDARPSLEKLVVVDDSGSYSVPKQDSSSATHPAPDQLDIKMLGTSISKWLKATAEMERVTSEANTRVRQQVAALQASIIQSQDSLSPDNTVGQRALARKIDCAERFHQTACHFSQVAHDVMCAASSARQLAKILDAFRQREPASFFESMPQVANENPREDRLWMANQLANLKLELEGLDNQADDASISQVSASAAILKAVMKALIQRSNKISNELRTLATEINDLDQTITTC